MYWNLISIGGPHDEEGEAEHVQGGGRDVHHQKETGVHVCPELQNVNFFYTDQLFRLKFYPKKSA